MSDTALAPPAAEKLVYSVDETMTVLGIARATLYQLINTGQLHTVKAGGRRLVPRSAILAFLEGGDHAST